VKLNVLDEITYHVLQRYVLIVVAVFFAPHQRGLKRDEFEERSNGGTTYNDRAIHEIVSPGTL